MSRIARINRRRCIVTTQLHVVLTIVYGFLYVSFSFSGLRVMTSFVMLPLNMGISMGRTICVIVFYFQNYICR